MRWNELCKNPYLLFKSAADRGWMNWLDDETYIKLLFKARMGKWPDLKNPRTFNEKLQWLKLHDRKPEYATMVDKFAAKLYVSRCIGEQYIIPTYGVWDRFEDIDFDVLPDRFVLKCTHDSGGLVICRDRKTFDKAEAKRKIEYSLRRNYFYNSREWPYKNVKPQILSEPYLEDRNNHENCEYNGLTDYKFYCFNGEPRIVLLSRGSENHETSRVSFITVDWKQTPCGRTDYKPFEQIPEKPARYEEMVRICRTLSKDHSFLRVDLYQIEDAVMFSELTFTPCSGMMPFEKEEQDLLLGSWLQLPQKES